MTPPPQRRRLGLAAAVLASATLLPGLTQLPAVADPATSAATTTTTGVRSEGNALHPDEVRTFGDSPHGPADVDLRGLARPLASQLRAATALGADVRWNDFGTPASISPRTGSLGRAASADPERAARAWLEAHSTLLGLPRAQVRALELVGVQELAQSPGRAVLLRQRFGALTPALGSMVTVGVANGRVEYVSSSLTRTTSAPAAATVSPLQAWRTAAQDVGLGVTDDVAERITAVVDGGVDALTPGVWTRLRVPGFAQEQQVRLRALALADGSVRPVLETNVVDSEDGAAHGFTVMVDAVSRQVLHRENKVEHSTDAFQFTGTVTATECGPRHPFELTDDATRQVNAVSVGAPTDDHVVKLFRPSGELLTSGDLGTNPEAATYAGDPLPAGTYSAQVCPFADPTVPVVLGPYALVVTTSDEETSTDGVQANPKWRFFPANPSLVFTPDHTPRNSVIGCWFPGDDDCSLSTGPLRGIAAPGPWDTVPPQGLSTFTTVGNNANTHEAWASPLTPGGLFQAPVSPTREYTAEFTDAWNNSRCDPAQLRPGGNDVDFSVGNLFVAHNRMHDYSYYLGFTEKNFNMQVDNLGRGGVGGDPETGNAQAGAITGANHLTGLGRDNANQITLQDGVPGITNQYLFQPIAGAFYAPCTDGGLDMGIVGHEYTHAISNRMVGGPDEGLTSEQGGAMGESWSDLVAAEYQFSHGYSTGGNVWAVGSYATGNAEVAIRDYAINRNPLNWSNYGFDTTGDEVHADGEIWNGINWEVRQALVRKHQARFPYGNRQLQLACAQGIQGQSPRHPVTCPGNRRWVALMFDSFLLQQGATSYLDARDAMLAADRMRFGGKNQKAMWDAFARRGLGKGARTPSADSGDTVPSFVSPRSRNARVTFRAPAGSKVYVGVYEARSTPVADTVKGTKLGASASFTPGTYRIVRTSPTHGFQRATLVVRDGRAKVLDLRGQRNLAALRSGAKVLAASAGSLNADALLDGTEATNWAGINAPDVSVDSRNPFVAVDLAGGVQTVRRLQVSALLRPSDTTGEELPVALAQDPEAGSRFTALRRFALEVCTTRCGSPSARWKRVFTSGPAAFPAVRPRPVAPNQTLRSFRLPRAVRAAAVRLVALENQCTGYAGYAGEGGDADPLNDVDCKSASDRDESVRAAELQVFAR
ncbi:M36 family metallopeptidase [Nocardioides perillae]|uniref:Fungalysin metallopeptidase (M36) n=1 Tax=Nocardioides perillae TaxID=1119534 RepID=A0A7Y9UKK5_9ACTN|nr:M36 family metallopeptidase [Nocardioides perillae]NYG55483.1 hypothetical protein [Nocardioides perillae]